MRRSVPTEFGLYLWTAITTGARRGEVSALRESRFDFARQQVRVSTNYIVKQGNRIEKAPKDGEGRVLSLDLLTCELLRERFQRRRAEAQVLGVQVPEDAFAFSPDPAGRTLWNPDTMTHRYRRYARRVGIASSPKELRHYSATQLLAAGTDLNTVAGRLGHAEGSTTLKFCAQFTRPTNQRAAAIIPSQLDGLRRKERVRELYRQHLSVSGGDGLAALAAVMAAETGLDERTALSWLTESHLRLRTSNRPSDPKIGAQLGARQQPAAVMPSLRWLAGQAAGVWPVRSGSASGMRHRVTSKPRAPSLPTWWAIWRRMSRSRS